MKLFITFLFIWFALCINAQNHHEDHSHNLAERHSMHEHTKSELGVAGIASFLGGGDFAPGIHLHYTYAITEPMGIGLGFEQLFGEHQHQTFSLVLNYRPIDRLTFALSFARNYSGKGSQ